MQVFKRHDIRFYYNVLNFLGSLCHREQEDANPDSAVQENVRTALRLSIMKVVNDCRAILLLTRAGFYIQAGILARSTMDACNLIMHIEVENGRAPLIEPWMKGERVTHWMLLDRINRRLDPKIQFDLDSYKEMRHRLDDFVHANYEALKLYPAQIAAKYQGGKAHQGLTFWNSLIYFYLISCLLGAHLIAPDLDSEIEEHLYHIITHMRRRKLGDQGFV